MWKRSLWVLWLAAPMFGQLDPHTLTISASRSIYLQPDEVVLVLSATSGVATSLEQVVSALSGVGITSSNLTGVNNTAAPPNLQWNFTLTTPFSNLTATLGSLGKLQQSITQNNSGLTLTFSVNGTQVSQQLRQSQSCSNSELIADATAQAQKLASAAGLTLGPVLKLSNAPLTQPELVVANFALIGFIVPNNFASFPVTCSLAVEFRLLP